MKWDWEIFCSVPTSRIIACEDRQEAVEFSRKPVVMLAATHPWLLLAANSVSHCAPPPAPLFRALSLLSSFNYLFIPPLLS